MSAIKQRRRKGLNGKSNLLLNNSIKLICAFSLSPINSPLSIFTTILYLIEGLKKEAKKGSENEIPIYLNNFSGALSILGWMVCGVVEVDNWLRVSSPLFIVRTSTVKVPERMFDISCADYSIHHSIADSARWCPFIWLLYYVSPFDVRLTSALSWGKVVQRNQTSSTDCWCINEAFYGL